MPPRPSRNETSVALRPKRNQGRPRAGTKPFWQTKTLDEMTPQEWESLCDGCGRCCMVKLEDEDTGEIIKTDIGCKLLDAGTCRCKSYEARHSKVDDCIQLTPESVRSIAWLPSTCAYRLIGEGKPLEAWHPLVSGSADTVHEAGISVRDRVAASERTVKLSDYIDHIVDWND